MPDHLDAAAAAHNLLDAALARPKPADVGIPAVLLNSLHNYVTYGIETGDFLRACLENDLLGACARADLANQRRLFEITSYIYNNLPSACCGSPSKVEKWLARPDWPEIRRSNNPQG